MAFDYYSNDKIKALKMDEIPSEFIEYYGKVSLERKDEIAKLRPDIAMELEGDVNGVEREEKYKEGATDSIVGGTDEQNEEQTMLEEEENDEIIEAWEEINLSSWQKGMVSANVLVCKVVPDGITRCGIHRISMKKVYVSYQNTTGRGIYRISGWWCPECMEFFLEEEKINQILEKLDELGVPVLIQPLEQTLEEWKNLSNPIEIQDDQIIFITDNWKRRGMTCPIHKEEVLIENAYMKQYKERRVDFLACNCEKCKKIIMKGVIAKQLEEDCGEVGIPPIEFRKLTLDKKEQSNKLNKRIKPKYFVQNGYISEYDFNEEIEWEVLSEDDVVVVSFSTSCSELEHETVDVLAIMEILEKEGTKAYYLVLMGYCSECEKYYIDQDDYKIIYEKGRPYIQVQDDTNSDYYITSGSIFDEENEHLVKLEGRLEQKIAEIEAHPDFVGKYSVNRGGYDDGGLHFRKALAEPLRVEKERYASYIPNPYAKRAEFSDGDSTKVYYLGPDDVIIDDQKIVISYNSDFGQELVNYQTIEMNIDGVKHKAKRRREYDISQGKLYGYLEQSDEDVIFGSGITDPFLVKVLNARKKMHQLLDIVATAQENQRLIMNLPLNENIVVQGCAGSGKTMVLLQRMSSLKYKNKDYDFGNAIILTPNDNFNTHIEGLVSSLQLGYIERKSVEGYYLQLLEEYDKSFRVNGKIIDEMSVAQEYVDFVYSDDFMQLFEIAYDKEITNISNYYEQVANLSKEFGREAKRNVETKDYELISTLIDELGALSKLVKNQEREKEKAEETLHNILRREKFLQDRIPGAENELLLVQQLQIKKMNEQLEVLLQEKNNKIIQFHSQKEELQQGYEKLQKSVIVLRKAQKLRGITEKITEVEQNINECLQELKKLDELKQVGFSDKSKDEVIKYLLQFNEYVPNVIDGVRLIERQFKVVNDYRIEAEELSEKKEVAQQELAHQMSTVYSEESKEEIVALSDKLSKMNAKSIYVNIYQIAAKQADSILEEKYGRNYVDKIKGTHRFDLYLQLHFAMRYFDKRIGTNTFICIDEGQDLALNEYKLLKRINPKDVLFNIYGDVNQLLKYERGISDWDSLKDIIGKQSIYTLNENYRNTNQITQFCNDSFDMNVSLTGADGHKVKEVIRSQLESLLSLLKVSEERIAIILPRSVKKNTYIKRDQLLPEIDGILGEEMGNGKIAIVYVDEVKGVEFDRVFVVPNGMKKNEKYIAYTRALSDLIVVYDSKLDVAKENVPSENNEKNEAIPVVVSKNIRVGKVRQTKKDEEDIKKEIGKSIIRLEKGSILDSKGVSAIVSPTNSKCYGMGIVENLIWRKAGDQLQKACEKIDILDAGQAVVTKGYKTGFDYIIHVNRPKYSDIDSDQILRKCYINILSQAAKQGIRSIGIPALSTNRYGFPEYRAANIAISTCLEFIIKYPDYIDNLNFMLYDPKSIAAYELVLKHAGKKADALVSIGKCSECGKRLRIRKSKFDEIIMNHNGVFTKYCSQCKPKE